MSQIKDGTIYKLNRQDILQAFADYITKKYGYLGKQEATVDVKFEGDQDRNALQATVIVKKTTPTTESEQV